MALRLTRPTPACRDTPLRGSAAARSATRRIMQVKFVNGRETVSAQCLETFADAAEVRETMNKSSHVCARVRVGEHPVSR